MADVEIKGLAELQKLLSSLPVKLEQNLLRGALRAGMKPIKGEAKMLAAKSTGEMAEGLVVGTRKKDGQVQATLKAKGKHGFVAPWIEYGTAAHRIPGPLNLASGWAWSVEHPGVRAQPFMRPALDSQGRNAVLAAANYLKEKLATKHGLDTADISIGDDDES